MSGEREIAVDLGIYLYLHKRQTQYKLAPLLRHDVLVNVRWEIVKYRSLFVRHGVALYE